MRERPDDYTTLTPLLSEASATAVFEVMKKDQYTFMVTARPDLADKVKPTMDMPALAEQVLTLTEAHARLHFRGHAINADVDAVMQFLWRKLDFLRSIMFGGQPTTDGRSNESSTSCSVPPPTTTTRGEALMVTPAAGMVPVTANETDRVRRPSSMPRLP